MGVVLTAPFTSTLSKMNPESGVKVIVVESPSWSKVETEGAGKLVPFSTMGESGGITVAVKPNDITVGTDDKRRKTAEYWVGIARNDIDVCGGCRGLIGI